MSILLRLKNKLQDPSAYEAKIREFDECMLFLKNENVELHKRINQLEALCKTSISTQSTHFLEEHIRQLEQENGRLFAENQCQRQEYERFLDQLTTMVLRTAVMQKNIRKECVSVYHVIERLSNLTTKAIQTEHRTKSLSWENLNKTCELFSNYRIQPKKTVKIIPSSSSSSSSTTHCSFSTSDSWTLDLSFEKKDTEVLPTSNKPKEEEEEEEEQEQVLQRSETFIISKSPQEELSSSPPAPPPLPSITMNDSNVQHCPITRTMATTTSPIVRPSRLPSRCSTTKTQSSNRSLSTQKNSKLPIRTPTSLNQQQTFVKKSNIPTPVVIKTKKDSTIASNRSGPSVNNTTIKKIIRPPSNVSAPLNKIRSRSTTAAGSNNISSSLNKRPRTTIETVTSSVKSDGRPIEQMNSTSSESSIEEQQQMNKLLPMVQDEGYSTWSSTDVKNDVTTNNIKKNGIDERQKNIGLVKNWLDISNRQCSKKPVKEVEITKLEEFTQELSDSPSFLCPFVRNRCSNGKAIPLTSTTISSSNKDISLDSLDSPHSNEQAITSPSLSSSSSSSSSFSSTETFEKVLITQTLSNIIDDLADSTSSTCSTFNMSEYIEDNLIDQDDNNSEDSTSFETTIITKERLFQPQKRLLFPGLLNRLIILRRISSDSDLQRKECSINENDNSSHVYHSNIINEHSVEVNLMHTYGSDTELHVWSHDCAEQRRFVHERQQQQLVNPSEENKSNHDQQLAIERHILLQQIYEYPWLLQENDLDRTTLFPSINNEQSLSSPASDLIVPLHNPDFYQLCTLTDSSSFGGVSYGNNTRHASPPIASTVL